MKKILIFIIFPIISCSIYPQSLTDYIDNHEIQEDKSKKEIINFFDSLNISYDPDLIEIYANTNSLLLGTLPVYFLIDNNFDYENKLNEKIVFLFEEKACDLYLFEGNTETENEKQKEGTYKVSKIYKIRKDYKLEFVLRLNPWNEFDYIFSKVQEKDGEIFTCSVRPQNSFSLKSIFTDRHLTEVIPSIDNLIDLNIENTKWEQSDTTEFEFVNQFVKWSN
jgi:hypothetical protein